MCKKTFSSKFSLLLLLLFALSNVAVCAELKQSSEVDMVSVITSTESAQKNNTKNTADVSAQTISAINVSSKTADGINKTDAKVSTTTAAIADVTTETNIETKAIAVSTAAQSVAVSTNVAISSIAVNNEITISSTAAVISSDTVVTVSTQPAVFAIENVKIPFQPNYAKKESWAALPENAKYQVDVFYVYPTIFGGQGYELMDISDENLTKKAKDYVSFNMGIFEGQANIYAPYYRQGSIELLKLNEQDMAQFLTTAITDIQNAFDYYMKNYNNGRPFILAGFSQGSGLILELMRSRFYDKQLQDKLVAAYIVGYSVTDKVLKKYPYLKMAKDSDDFGVIISYNTQLAKNGYSKVMLEGAQAINPISWKTNNKPSKEKQYKGAVMFDSQTGKISGNDKPFKIASLEKGTNALIVDVDIKKYTLGQDIFSAGVLHNYDYMFFYNNLKDNAALRISNYLRKNK